MPELQLPQGTIQYREDGSGPPVLFVLLALTSLILTAAATTRLTILRRTPHDRSF
ncbi:MAG: hypothetical protein ACRDPD_25560 [Streptosporangiaceae bacterium]